MRSLVRSLRSSTAYSPISLDQYIELFTYAGNTYPLRVNQTLPGEDEPVGAGFAGYAESFYKRNGVVAACMMVRQRLFSEARFQWRQYVRGRPGNLFGTPELQILETPWPNGTTGDLLVRAITDVDLAGNAFFARRPDGLQRLRPDWVTIIRGERSPVDVRTAGYAYQPGGPGSGQDPIVLTVDEVAHLAPIPDPLSEFGRGMSWLTPIIREITADSAATTHKLKFFEHGATPNMVVKLDPAIKADAFERFVEKMEESHAGVLNAYKTLYLGGGADVTVVGADLKQLDFKIVQGAGETRIAAAAGIPPVIVGLSEGLQAATYSNYGQARRSLADGTLRPLWRAAARAFGTIVAAPPGAELWYDDRDIAFLREDLKDQAEIQQMQASAIKSLVDSGFRADSAVDAVVAGDLSRLVHTGLFSVQLQKPGTNGQGKSEEEEEPVAVAPGS